ncbi:MAG: hypothetical protein ACSHYA_13995 [Opitutaceae bacterium]
MPNQLAQTKKRKTVAEHAAVLALLDRIAEVEGTTSTELLRSAAREVVRQYAGRESFREDLESVFQSYQPQLLETMQSAKDLSRYKRETREYDELALDLGFQNTEELQARNSIHSLSTAPVLVGNL